MLARRLSNAEYNYTIRDLTGVDIQPTREFPVDPSNPAGFDNSGESLAMSPALLDKYLQAAREVANHMVLKPDGITFAPHLMLADTDRDKYCVNQVLEFYARQATDYSEYFQTAWRFKHRAALGKAKATLADFAVDNKVSAKYLAMIWQTLEGADEEIGPIAKLQRMWCALPAPHGNQPELARDGCERMRDFVVQLRKRIEPRFPLLSVEGIGRISVDGEHEDFPLFQLWQNHQEATHRRTFDRTALRVEGETRPGGRAAKLPEDAVKHDPSAEAPSGQGDDSDLLVPAGQRTRYEAAFERFSALFPDNFYVSERGRKNLDVKATAETARPLSAGFYAVVGYFRDDLPLYELILDEKGQQELDTLWREFDFVAGATARTYEQFYAREVPLLNLPPVDGREPASETVIRQVAAGYLAKARESSSETAVQAIEHHFETLNKTLRRVEKERTEAEPSHLEAIQQFAARAYRRPLSPGERDDLISFYRSLREKDALSHEDAMRDLVVNVLMSPDFCYRIDLVDASAGRGGNGAADGQRAAATSRNSARAPVGATGVMGRPAPAASSHPAAAKATDRPLSDHALASRLSYFLWASMPDEQLLARAAAGVLHKPEVLTAQALRMLKDQRVRRLATEFGGNWLDFRRFEEHNAVDRERFPSFNDELRQAMFEEPIHFIDDLILNDRSVLDLLYADYTFVNPVLAKHYGMPKVDGDPSEWVRVANAGEYGRGGLLPMSAFLTKNAPGLRTSPVKRGYWLVRRVLGETIPPPPAVVPELPRDEAKMELPLRDELARHRADASCSSCHTRFDSFGLALEGYGPIGEVRTKDLAGRPVDARAAFPSGEEGDGLEGLKAYLRGHREADFIENLCRKMFVYALGRSRMLSDEPTIKEIRDKMAANGNRFSTLVEGIVTSPQFLKKQGGSPD